MHFVHWAEKAWPGLVDWLASGVRSACSEAIVDVVCGIECLWDLRVCAPMNKQDDSYCLELLRMVPSIAPHLGQLSRISPKWAEAVERLRLDLKK